MIVITPNKKFMPNMIPRDINRMRIRIKGATNRTECRTSRADRGDGTEDDREGLQLYSSNESGWVVPLITVSPADKINAINAYGDELREYYRVAARDALVIGAGKLGWMAR